ncbi:MAG: hypothetical protein ABW142_11140 [Thermoleophilaceae bacterium]
MPKRDAVEVAAEELYGLPPGEFTRARDERAKQLRADGEREAATAVKALRKPTVAAWALNQLARSRRKELEALLSAGEGLRAAQEELLAGGDRAGFQKAAARERDLVAKLAAEATAPASEAGERGTGLQEKVAATLHAAALDEETAEELRAGRLVKEREAVGGFGEEGGGEVPATVPKRRPAKRSPRRSQPAPRAPTAARAGEREARQARDERQVREARQALSVARTGERHARRELDAAERAVQHAQERADAAEAHAKEATERARTTAERLREAKRAQTAARRAHAGAERALEKAQSARS